MFEQADVFDGILEKVRKKTRNIYGQSWVCHFKCLTKELKSSSLAFNVAMISACVILHNISIGMADKTPATTPLPPKSGVNDRYSFQHEDSNYDDKAIEPIKIKSK